MNLTNVISRIVGRKPQFDPKKVHYLHIGKTAGNQIKVVCRQMEEDKPGLKFELHSHGTHLYRLPEEAKYFFSMRYPVTRFRAGFYERKRQGRNGGNYWSKNEALSFGEFEHAVDLAEAIFDNSPRGELARASMHSIQHVRKLHFMWFHPLGHFLTARPPVWILRQENFDADLEQLARRLGLPGAPELRADSRQAKITNYDDIPELTPKAVENLERWYAADIMFYRDCVNWLERNQ